MFTSTRRRKLKIFDGFKKRAVVVVPNDDVYKQQLDLAFQSDEEKKNLAHLINNMKSGITFFFWVQMFSTLIRKLSVFLSFFYSFIVGFTLPKADDYDSIEYVGLAEVEAQKLIEFYNSQGATDRLEQLLARRAKKNEEISKWFKFVLAKLAFFFF